jgi:hypothetical protein
LLAQSVSLTCRRRTNKLRAEAGKPVTFFGSAWDLGN